MGIDGDHTQSSGIGHCFCQWGMRIEAHSSLLNRHRTADQLGKPSSEHSKSPFMGWPATDIRSSYGDRRRVGMNFMD